MDEDDNGKFRLERVKAPDMARLKKIVVFAPQLCGTLLQITDVVKCSKITLTLGLLGPLNYIEFNSLRKVCHQIKHTIHIDRGR